MIVSLQDPAVGSLKPGRQMFFMHIFKKHLSGCPKIDFSWGTYFLYKIELIPIICFWKLLIFQKSFKNRMRKYRKKYFVWNGNENRDIENQI